MLNITITEQTPHNMLRAIRAACNEMLGETSADLTTQAAQHNSRAVELHAAAEAETDKAAACLTGSNAGNTAVPGDFSEELAASEADSIVVTSVGANDIRVENGVTIQVLTDSTGAEWNPELHASTKAKNQDGTWKKRRGSAQQSAGTDSKQEVEEMLSEEHSASPTLPPLPPAPPAAPLVTMNDIYALMTNGKAVLNDVIAGAQAMGFADVGAFSRDATPEQRAQLLDQLTKEVA